MGKCNFLDKWLQMKDANNHTVSEWSKKRENNELFCTVCDVVISTEKGFYSIKRHSESEKHKSNFKQKKSPDQLLLVTAGTSNADASSTDVTKSVLPCRLYSVKDSAFTAELIWCLKLISSNIPIQTCHDIGKVFQVMFPEAALPKQFSLNPTKASYLISDALAPYFRELCLKEVQSAFYSLEFDETTNSGGFKELQTRVRFWSKSKSKVLNHHLETFFLGHAKATDIVSHLLKAIDNAGLPLSNILMLSSDGPNVNKSVWKLMNEEVKSVRDKGLINIGFCNIHMLHNAFLKGMCVFGSNASDLIISLFHYFDDWPARREDFSKILSEKTLKDVHFMKHVNSRWLTLEPAANRVLELWDGIIEYFLKFIPLKQAKDMERQSYKKIAALLRIKTIKAEIKFICVSTASFTRYTGFFQKEEPLVHMMHKSIKELVMKLIGRVCKIDSVKNLRKDLLCFSDIFDEEHLLPLNDIPLSDDILNCIKTCSDAEKRNFRANIQKHYIAACNYIINKNVLSNELLKYFSCIEPEDIKKTCSLKRIERIASYLPFEINPEELMDEWKLLQFEVLQVKEIPIETFWNNVSNIKGINGCKYENVMKVVRAVLTLSHGSADVERGFSKSTRTLSDERASMSVRTLNAHLTVSDAMKSYQNKPELVPIGEKLLSLARVAYKSYNLYLESEKKRKEELKAEKEAKMKEINENKRKMELYEKSKKDISELETRLETMRNEVGESSKTSDTLLEDANKRLKKALLNNDLAEAKVAQAMIDGALFSKEDCKKKQKSMAVLDKQLHKRKNTVMTNFFSKKPKL